MFEKNRLYVEKVMAENDLDALIMPISTHGSATYDANTVNTWRVPIASNAGLPAISTNAGYNPINNMPIGIEFIGKKFSEGQLIEIAYAFEEISPPRIPPILPEPDSSLSQLSIAQLNNLFTLIGSDSYEQVIKKDGTEKLTPKVFREIVIQAFKKLNYSEAPIQ